MKYLKNFNTLLEYEDALILDMPNTSYIVEEKIVKYSELPKVGINYIMYKSSNGLEVTPYNTDVFGASLISNKYDGFGLISFDGSVASIGESAFRVCTTLTSIAIPKSVTSIGSYAFALCNSLPSITIPNSVVSIGNSAFRDCRSLTSITIPDSVTSIGIGAFNSCSLTSPVYNAHCFAYMPTSYAGAYTIPEGIKQIAGEAFKGCSSLTSITIPDGVTGISNGTFYNCSSLTSIVIPDGVTSIGEQAFYGCSSLTSITIGNNITSLGSHVFYGCSSLTSVTINSNAVISKHFGGSDSNMCGKFGSQVKKYIIGDSVTTIGSHAFMDCSSLISITIPNSVTSIGDHAFEKCSSLTSIPLPNSVTSIKEHTFSNCSSLISVVIPDGVTSIGEQAFYKCSSLPSITIPNSVTSIGDKAFYPCSSLTKTNYTGDIAGWCAINFTDATSNPIGLSRTLFINDQEIKDLVIPNNAVSIKKYTFYNCDSLTSVTIEDGVTSIGLNAFAYCSSLTSITIPNSVTSIGNGAFYECPSLTTIVCEATTPPTLDSNNGLSNVTIVYVPAESVDLYKTATNWSYYASKIQATYIPQTCSLLTITANDVIGNKRTTTIHWEALTSGVDFRGNTIENVRLSGTVISDIFELNLSTTDTVQRTITYTYLGMTAETTITLGVWINQQYTLDLNNLWELSTDLSNPDISLYEGVYQSFSNYNTNSSTAKAYLTLIGYTDFDLYIRSNAEGYYDYTTVSEVNSDAEKASTKGKQSFDLSINGYLKVSYTNLDPYVTCTITITYKKDGTSHSGTDRGYLLIPRYL